MKRTIFSTLKPAKYFAILPRLSVIAALFISICTFTPEVKAAEKFTPATLEEVMQVVESHKGEVVVLNIFASWCPPCVQEAHTFVQFYQKYPPQSGVHLYGISLDDDISELRGFISNRSINFPVYHCGQDFVDHFEIETIPTLIVFDREGNLVEYRIGIASMKELTEIMGKYK